ncbi:hypothetical protein JHK87_000821 [Glycine soja]|nr:hypothetical protein JHK87_000821 [Glycine soja]
MDDAMLKRSFGHYTRVIVDVDLEGQLRVLQDKKCKCMRIFLLLDDVGRSILIIFKIFAGLLESSVDIQAQRRTRFFSAGRGRLSAIARGNVVVIPFYRFQHTGVLLTLLMPFLSF